jgi:hypothetical protein
MERQNINDPSVGNMKRRYEARYADKPAYKEVDLTAWTGTSVFLLHTLSCACAFFAARFFGFTGIEQTAVGVLWGGVCCLIEYFKSVYSERYQIASIKSLDGDIKEDEREMHFEKSLINKRILYVFWSVSLAIVVYAASQLAMQNAPELKLLTYDAQIENVLLEKQRTLALSRDRGAKLTKITDLQNEVTSALSDWKAHKATVDGENRHRRTEHTNGMGIYIFFGLLFGFAIETAIYYMRRFHERKQYEIHKSLTELSNSKQKSINGNPQNVVNYDAKIDLLTDELKKMKDSLLWRNKEIDELKAEKLALEKILGNGHLKA